MTDMETAAPLPRWPWALTIVAAAVMIGAMAAMGAVPNQVACDGAGGLPAIVRFEWVRSVEELTAFFGTEPCRSALARAMDGVNTVDVTWYIPAFTAFQLLAAWALRPNGRLFAIVAINVAMVAAGCDLLEDNLLFLYAWAAQAGEAYDPAALGNLYWLVRAKFALLAVNGLLLGWLVGRWPGTGWMAARWLMIAGGCVGLAGLAHPALLTPGIGLVWAVLLVVAMVRVRRPAQG